MAKYGDLQFVQGDLLNSDELKNVFKNFEVDAVLHFAGVSQIAGSVDNPQKYYTNNVCGTINLLNSMLEYDVKKIVFSSSAAIYGEPCYIPIDENHPQNPINPYGETKLIVEKNLEYSIMTAYEWEKLLKNTIRQ